MNAPPLALAVEMRKRRRPPVHKHPALRAPGRRQQDAEVPKKSKEVEEGKNLRIPHIVYAESDTDDPIPSHKECRKRLSRLLSRWDNIA